MDGVITGAARALAAGDALAALKRVALRDDPAALALRGIAMAQLGDLSRARDLLRMAARRFGGRAPLAAARCRLAEAEVAVASRDLVGALGVLGPVRQALSAGQDRTNAAHAASLEARLHLLIGQPDRAEAVLDTCAADDLPPASRPGYWLITAGIAIRRTRADPARAALLHAQEAALRLGVPALSAEVAKAWQSFEAPAARLISRQEDRLLTLANVEAILASDALVVDARANLLRAADASVALSGRPVLFALLRTLAEAWPGDVPREVLLARAFGARSTDESHRVRLRVEMGRLRALVPQLAEVRATGRGFRLDPARAQQVVVLAPPAERPHADILALLADGEAWGTPAMALALGVSTRTVQRGLEALEAGGAAESFGRGRATRWVARRVPGLPTHLSLHTPITPD